MDRRNFMYRTIAGVAGAAAGIGMAQPRINLVQADPKEKRSVTYSVKGFSCITCATGLETMLLRQGGITHANTSYPEAKVIINFDERLTSEDAIQEFIANCGFSVTQS